MTNRLALALVVLANLAVVVLDAPLPYPGSVGELLNVPIIGTREGEAEALAERGQVAQDGEHQPDKLERVGSNPTLAPSSANRPVRAGEGVPSNTGGMEGGCGQSWPCATNDERSVTSTQDNRPAGGVAEPAIERGPLPAVPEREGVMPVMSSNVLAPEEVRRNLEFEGGRAGTEPPPRDATERSGSRGMAEQVDPERMAVDAGSPALGPVGMGQGARGLATYYGLEFGGHRMANGEPYNPYALTAACNTCEMGQVLEVTYSKTITVVVTDRGAFSHELDLSLGAFKALVGSTDPGVISVTVRVLE